MTAKTEARSDCTPRGQGRPAQGLYALRIDIDGTPVFTSSGGGQIADQRIGAVDVSCAERVEVQMKGRSVGERGGNAFISDALINEDHADARLHPPGQSVAFERQLTRVEGMGQGTDRCNAHPLRHRNEHRATVGFGQQALVQDEASLPKGRSQIEAADESIFGNVGGHPANRRAAQDFV